jgi:hypothetical protein
LTTPGTGNHLWKQRVGLSLEITLGKNEEWIFLKENESYMSRRRKNRCQADMLTAENEEGGRQVLKWFY